MNKISSTSMRTTLIVMLLAMLTTLAGCIYKMPTDDCISTLPTMNNPMITREKGSSFMMPGR